MSEAASLIALARKLEQSISLAPAPTAPGVESVRIGAFRVWFNQHTDNPQLNYAMPVTPIEPALLGAAVEGLRVLFATRARKVRVEFVEELWPGLAAALHHAGMHLQAREPLMACSSIEFVPGEAGDVNVRRLSVDDSDADLAAYLHIADERPADGSHPVSNEAIGVSHEAIVVLRETLRIGEETSVLGTIDGRPAAVGRWIAQADGLGEIVGIVTLPEFRRRGAAATIVSALLRGVFASGRDTAWLNADNEQARSVYAKLGFRTIGSLLNYEE